MPRAWSEPLRGGGGTDLGSVFTYAWTKFSENVGEWVVLWLVALGIAIFTRFVGIALSVGTSFGGFNFSIGGIIYNVIVGVVTGILLVALAKGAVMAVNGQTVDVGAAFKLTPNNLIAGAVLGAAAALLDFVFCGLGGILAYVFLGWLPVMSALDDKGAEAISESISNSTSNPAERMVWMLITWFLVGICFIGAPVAMIGGVYILKKDRGEAVA